MYIEIVIDTSFSHMENNMGDKSKIRYYAFCIL